MWSSEPARSGPTTSKTNSLSPAASPNASLIGAFRSQQSSHTDIHPHCALLLNQGATAPQHPTLLSMPRCRTSRGNRLGSCTKPSNQNTSDASHPKLSVHTHIPEDFNFNHQFCRLLQHQIQAQDPKLQALTNIAPDNIEPAGNATPLPSSTSTSTRPQHPITFTEFFRQMALDGLVLDVTLEPHPSRSQTSCTFSNR